MSVLSEDPLSAAEARIADLEAQVAELRSPAVAVLREPRTYQARLVRDSREESGFRAVSIGEPQSYVRDLTTFRRAGDLAAGERLARHGRECEVDRERRRLDIPEGVEFTMDEEGRAPTSSYADPPLWINQYLATYPRAERVLSARAPGFDLPPGCSTVSLPRWTTGTLTGQQAPGGTVASRDVTDAAVTSHVSAIAGNSDWPLQMLEQSPQGAHLDFLAFTDMASDYALQLETAMLNGSGTGTSLLGLLNNLPAVYTNNPNVVYTDPSPTGTEMFTALGKVPAAINRNRQLNGEIWMMHGARSAWIATAEDTAGRPLIIANTDGAGHFDLATVPVAINDAIQPIYGASGTEERIIMTRPSDYLVLESEQKTDVMEDVLSGLLMVRLQLRRSVAALCRYPSSNAILSGTGLIPVAGY